MAEFGIITLYAMLLLATWSAALAMVSAGRRQVALLSAARYAAYATAVVSTLSLLVLTYAFAVSDFSIKYVHQYSSRDMPVFYRLTAVWGGQSGSLLVWAWMLAVLTAWAVHANRVRLKELMPWVIVALMLTLDFFCVVMLLSANPFDTFLMEAPAAGRGLNPLLQNPYMVVHPPALYVGYVGMAIPFAFALGALICGSTDERWIAAVRPFALGSWYFLTLGLVLGMIWAYEELGWGGYWGWDPVENAGLLPWLTSTAYLHTVMVQERRRLLRMLNVILATVTFLLTIFGTFLTRSGFIQSVHAFARSSIGWYFLGFMLLVMVLSIAVIIWRRRLLTGRGELGGMLSREMFFVIVTIVLCVATVAVMVLTMMPNISQIFGDKLVIKPEIFNKWMTPIGLALLALTALGPGLSWRNTSANSLRRILVGPSIAGVVLMAGLFALGLRKPLPLVVLGACGFGATTLLLEVWRGLRARQRMGSSDLVSALIGLVLHNRKRYGAILIHLGVLMMYVGFAGEAYKDQKEITMKRGQRATVGSYTLRYDGAQMTQDEQKRMLTATLSVYQAGQRLGSIHPARWIYYSHQDQPTTEVDIRRTLREDLFVALGNYDPKNSLAGFKLIVNPLVNWIWIGFLLMTLGAGVAMFPARLIAARRLSRRTDRAEVNA